MGMGMSNEARCWAPDTLHTYSPSNSRPRLSTCSSSRRVAKCFIESMKPTHVHNLPVEFGKSGSVAGSLPRSSPDFSTSFVFRLSAEWNGQGLSSRPSQTHPQILRHPLAWGSVLETGRVRVSENQPPLRYDGQVVRMSAG